MRPPFRIKRGFTLLEMMVVVAISLSMVALIVPIFQVTTRTVKAVELKLSLYESARNILDGMEMEIRQAVLNERGEHFSIKTWVEEDSDPFTRDEDGNPATPDTKRYYYSRREGDVINYLKPGSAAYRFAPNLMRAGSMAYPMAYPEISESMPEGWKCSMRSMLAYPNIWNNYEGYLVRNTPVPAGSKPAMKPDVSLIELEAVNHLISNQHTGTQDRVYQEDAIPRSCAPGFEIKLTANNSVDSSVGNREDPRNLLLGMMAKEIWRTKNRKPCAFRAMDFAVDYWDDVAKKYVEPPDKTVIYFWPPPKAIRLTITVCDANKRGQITLTRIVHLKVGMGDGQVNDAQDTQWLDSDPNPWNRTKRIKNSAADTSNVDTLMYWYP